MMHKLHCCVSHVGPFFKIKFANMQDALVGSTDKSNGSHEKDGELFYDYEVVGAVSRQLSSRQRKTQLDVSLT